MTSLLIDLGNTRLKWALARHGKLLDDAFGATSADSAGLPWNAWRAEPLAQVLLAGVPAAAQVGQLQVELQAQLQRPVIVVRTQRQWRDLVNGYRQPADLGVDRWLGLVAARAGHPGQSLLVVSAGTALTVDALGADGRHRGGAIAPGLTAMRRGLMTAAPALQRHDGGIESDRWACASDDAIASGCLQAAIGLIERARLRLDGDAGSPVLVTGGDAPRLLPWLAAPAWHRPRLVLEGLALHAELPATPDSVAD